MSFMDIAVVDISPLENGSRAEKASAARAFGRAFETTGFAVIVGHGVSDDLAQNVYGCLKRFFALPFEAKAAHTPPEQAKGRGYLPMGIESVARTLTGETPPDLCEALVFSAPHRELRGAPSRNIWPASPPSRSTFRKTICSSPSPTRPSRCASSTIRISRRHPNRASCATARTTTTAA